MDAALDQLQEHGVLGGLNLRQIADRVGVTPANIYHYFGSGRGLLRAALTRESRRLSAPVEVAAELPFTERRLAMFDEILRSPDLRLGALLALDDDPDYQPLPFAASTFDRYQAQVEAGDLPPELDLVAAHLVPLATSIGVAIFREAAARQLGLEVDELTRRARHTLEVMVPRPGRGRHRRPGRRTGRRGGEDPEVPSADGVLLDIDGVLTQSWRALPGAVEAVDRLRADGAALALVTNATSRSRAGIVDRLHRAGFTVADDDVLTTVSMTAEQLRRHHPQAQVLLVNSGDVASDLRGIDLVDPDDRDAAPDVVVLGGAGPELDYATANRIFALMADGVPVLAMNPNLTWRTDDGLQLDTGAFLLGLEAASGRRAQITGKPAPAFFGAALDHLGVAAERTLMVGDDLVTDVLGAQAAGLRGVLVRTGKFRPETLAAAEQAPDHVVDSVADVPDLRRRLLEARGL